MLDCIDYSVVNVSEADCTNCMCTDSSVFVNKTFLCVNKSKQLNILGYVDLDVHYWVF